MSWLTNSDASKPQLGQMNFTGCASISGVASNAYFAPQEHCNFMMRYFFVTVLLGFGIQ